MANKAIAVAVMAALGSLTAPLARAEDPEIQALKEQIRQLQKHVTASAGMVRRSCPT